MESVTFDELDRQLVQALQIDGRVPFSRVGAALGVSDQTIARRYRRLRSLGALRVVGSANTHRFGYGHWLVRLRCTPDAAGSIAAALARRSDTSWVHLLSGGTEITCNVRSWTAEEHNALLLRKLPRTAQIQSITAHNVIHFFAGAMVGLSGDAGWHRLGGLTREQVTALRAPSAAAGMATAMESQPEAGGPGADRFGGIEPGDRELVEALREDGRLPYGTVAARLGRSESAVRRRVEALRALGVLYFDVDVSEDIIGPHVAARIWISVAPSELVTVGEAMARHPEVVLVAATTGPTNLFAVVLCRDGADLFRYLTRGVGALTAARDIETAPVVRTVKREVVIVPGI